MPHNDPDDKVHLAGEGPLADSQEPAAVEAANASLRACLLRALAEVENTRRRAERSAADAREYAISGFAGELLSVVDNLHSFFQASFCLGAGRYSTPPPPCVRTGWGYSDMSSRTSFG
jgi:molecular chaperone GrpE (heat shock protein)